MPPQELDARRKFSEAYPTASILLNSIAEYAYWSLFRQNVFPEDCVGIASHPSYA